MIRLSANLGFLWPHRPLLERIAAAGRAGFRAVELHWPFETPAGSIAQACAEAGVELLAVNTPIGNAARGEFGLGAVPGREAEFLSLAAGALDYCAAAGGSAVHAMAGIAPETPQTRRSFNDNLRRTADAASERGLALLIEPINHYDKPGYFLSRVEQAVEMIDVSGMENIRILFDAYHVARQQGDVISRLQRALPFIGHIQIASVPSRAEPDEGELDYGVFLQVLNATAYQGWIGCEYRPRGDTDEGLIWRTSLVPS